MNSFSPIFLVGPPRSGTTFLQSILGSHTQIETLPETHYFEILFPLIGLHSVSSDRRLSSFEYGKLMSGLEDTGIRLDRLKTVPESNRTVAGLFEALIHQYDRPDAAYVLEKTPGHIRFMPHLQQLFPQAKFIAVVRHPVESIASMMHQRPISPEDSRLRYIYSFAHLIRHWKKHARCLFEFENTQFLTIRYEDLITDPGGIVQAICAYLGLAFEDQMLSLFADTASKFVNLEFEPWKSDNTESKIIDNRWKWRKKLSRRQVWFIEDQTREYIARLGYERSPMPTIFEQKLAIFEDKLRGAIRRSDLEKRFRLAYRLVSRRGL